MKKYILFPVLLAVSLLTFTSCSEDDLDKQSVITLDQVEYTEFDYWLQANYVQTYNIDFKYRYEDKESDMNYYTVPADYDQAIMMAHLVKYLCLEAYDEVAGPAFTRANFPKMIFTIGEFEYRNNGTFILGTAEGGKKILLTGVNYLNTYINNAEVLNTYYFKTIHHEFTHILNQTKDYSIDYKTITGNDYVADNWSEAPYAGYDENGNDNNYFLSHGFITSYAQHSHQEDFAEMLSEYVCNPESEWNARLTKAGTDGARKITAKLDIVREYMQTSWGIDIDQMRNVIQRRQNEVAAGKIDLTDLSID
ncbi:MAG: putative zinc-binding metallopeptidase [Prevotella sp.]|nr:putative zinc-binding metallopeptidase [Prevotella sp.]